MVDLPLSNDCVKILKYMYRHPEVSKSKLFKKFKSMPNFVASLITLCDYFEHPYLIGCDPSGRPDITYDPSGKIIKDLDTYIINTPGIAYVDKINRDDTRWRVSTVIAVIGAVNGTIALIWNILSSLGLLVK